MSLASGLIVAGIVGGIILLISVIDVMKEAR
jgi:hypothetical protein